jgi:GDP-D-mannose dehydratase
MTKHILLTGVTGYIGGSIAKKMLDSGYQVLGLIRDAIKKMGIQPLVGSLDDATVLIPIQCLNRINYPVKTSY